MKITKSMTNYASRRNIYIDVFKTFSGTVVRIIPAHEHGDFAFAAYSVKGDALVFAGTEFDEDMPAHITSWEQLKDVINFCSQYVNEDGEYSE